MFKTIHIITHEFPPVRGGAGVYCLELAMAASSRDHVVNVWAPKGSSCIENFKVCKFSWVGSQGMFSSFRLVRVIKKYISNGEKKDIFHLAEPGCVRAFVRFGWMIKPKIRFYLTIHGSELIRFTKNKFEKYLFRKLLRRCEKIHVLSEFNRQKIIELFPETKDKIAKIPGAPSTYFVKEDTNFSQHKKDGKINILCVGRLHPRKGQDQLLQALNQLPVNLQKKIVVRLVGPHRKVKFVEKLQKLKLQSRSEIIFHGDLTNNELKKVYEKSDIFCLTSMPHPHSVEGFGFVYLDASLHGLPILANRTGGVEDAVLENKTGILVDPGDIDSLTTQLMRLISDDNLCKLLGENGRKWARENSWDRVARELYEIN